MSDEQPENQFMISPPPARRLRGALLNRWSRFAAIAAVFLAAGAVLGVVCEHLVKTPDAATRLTQHQDWRVICPPMTQTDTGCTLSNSIARAQGGGTLAMISLGSTAPGAKLNVIVPHGVLLDAGMGFAVGDAPSQTLPYETCDQNGCVVLVTLDAATLTAMKTKANGQVSVAAMGQQQPVVIPFSLAGFVAGYDDLRREDGKRGSFLRFLYR